VLPIPGLGLIYIAIVALALNLVVSFCSSMLAPGAGRGDTQAGGR